jgi:hypothetical protein
MATWAKSVKIAVEIMGAEGPTGEFREVTEVAVRDYGDNEHWRGSADDYSADDYRPPKGGVPTKLVATKVAPEVYKGHEIYPDILADYDDLD